MRPLFFLIGVFGFLYVLWSYIAGIHGTEIGILAAITWDVYQFGRLFYAPSDPLTEALIYTFASLFFLVIFFVMVLIGIFGHRKTS